jgi:hypothetical protein
MGQAGIFEDNLQHEYFMSDAQPRWCVPTATCLRAFVRHAHYWGGRTSAHFSTGQIAAPSPFSAAFSGLSRSAARSALTLTSDNSNADDGGNKPGFADRSFSNYPFADRLKAVARRIERFDDNRFGAYIVDNRQGS